MTESQFENAGIRVRRVETCFLCGEPGKVLHTGLRDRLFGVAGDWNHRRCGNCGLVWLDPKPIPEDIAALYRTYFADMEPGTNGNKPEKSGGRVIRSIQAAWFGQKALLPGPIWFPIGLMGGMLPMLRDYAAAGAMFLGSEKPGKLLDVGCGMGGFLLSMRELGWDVYGLEPYETAANIARERGIQVLGATVEKSDLPPSMDVITSCHVIEHVDDPAEFFRKSLDALKPGGKLVVLTPNAESLGHRLFDDSWVHLDAPRHFNLFSRRALRSGAERAGFHVLSARTITRGSIFSYLFSRQLKSGVSGWKTLNKDGKFKHQDVLRARGFWLREEATRMVSPGAGEELLLVAKKPV